MADWKETDIISVDQPGLTMAERLYLPQILGGIATTLRHLFRKRLRDQRVVQYPEQKRPLREEIHRGVHRLNRDEQGRVACVACFMCATACPAECIAIEAGEYPDKRIEKYPVRFDIDMLRCVMCGLCVDACPEEAIVMTQDYEMSATTRAETVYPIALLADRPQLKQTPAGYRPRYEPGPTLVR